MPIPDREDFLDLVFTGKSEIADPIAARMAVATGVAGAESIGTTAN